jgi:2-hydroxycyclohexanecarboxyl-CoA dehydrogenase
MIGNRTAVVTGGASGIGRGIALRLAADGADVAIWDLDEKGAHHVAGEIEALGRRAIGRKLDVSRFDDVLRVADETRHALGALTIVVNNAGIGKIAKLINLSEADWDQMIDVHMKGTFACSKAVVKDMLDAKWGRIVNISSIAGLMGVRNMVHYAAAKAGIIGFTKALAQDLGRSGITVNAIAPGVIETPILAKADMTEEMVHGMVRGTPLGRAGKPEDIAAACSYLASEEAGFITGQVISPNGGMWM